MWLLRRECRLRKVGLCSLITSCFLLSVVLSRLRLYRQWRMSESRDGRNSDELLVNWNLNSSAATSARREYNVSSKSLSWLPETTLDDIFISVKTTGIYHGSRIELLLKTWLTLAQNQTYIFTDTDDSELSARTGHRLINTNCSSNHFRTGLCCKMSVEFDYFIQSKQRWFCHVDDDTYVNVVALVKLLQNYRHIDDWYLGKPSLAEPLMARLRTDFKTKIPFWFATGGAGFCLSRSLAMKMSPHVIGRNLVAECDNIVLPDDCAVGFIIYHYLREKLTVIKQFSSHLEHLSSINVQHLPDQITVSYNAQRPTNIVNVAGFSQSDDPTRFLSVHCMLYSPYATYCSDSEQHANLPLTWLSDRTSVLGRKLLSRRHR